MEKAIISLKGYIESGYNFISNKEIFKQLISKLEFLHNSNFAHRDIKPANILIFKNESE